MSSKNNTQTWSDPVSPLPENLARQPRHSLRLRLILWYGGLLALGLTCFALLMLALVNDAIHSNMQHEVGAETASATHNLSLVLSEQPPYWPPQLELEALDTYHTPGLTIEVFTLQGRSLYTSDPNKSLGLDKTVIRELGHGNIPVWYNAQVGSDWVLVQATPVYPPPGMSTGITPSTHIPMIGVLLVAKSLHDTISTLMLLQGLLLLTGVIILVLFLGCGWAVVGYALRPLSDLVKTSSSIATTLTHGGQGGNLSQRVPRPGGDDELAQVVDAFNEMLTSIESSTTVQRRFIADASHELRAPLTTIQGNLAFLLRYSEEIPADERQTMLADAHGETLRLASLVEELLLLARADANIGQASVPTLPAPIVELDRTLLKLVRQMRRRLEIEEEASPTIEIGSIDPVRVHGDEENLRRIMVILLDNAVKYTSVHHDEGKITVSLQRVNGQAVLRVSDTGIGIDAKDLPHIFERFYRADLARSRAGGTGLGLSIAQTLVEQLHGNISATSTPGKGSTFRVSLPLT